MQKQSLRSGLLVSLGIVLALGSFSLGASVASAQAKSCAHEGKSYKDGDELMIGGQLMVCDGKTGSWVAAKP